MNADAWVWDVTPTETINRIVLLAQNVGYSKNYKGIVWTIYLLGRFSNKARSSLQYLQYQKLSPITVFFPPRNNKSFPTVIDRITVCARLQKYLLSLTNGYVLGGCTMLTCGPVGCSFLLNYSRCSPWSSQRYCRKNQTNGGQNTNYQHARTQ